MRLSSLVCAAIALSAVGCSCSDEPDADADASVRSDGSAPGADGSLDAASSPDDGGNTADVLVPTGCTPGSTQCSDCVDNDGDGRVDGYDPECTSAADNREDSFATGIPGDNIDSVFQDCFYDGNSGQEDDGCMLPTCCLLDPDGPSCPPSAPPGLSCTPSAECAESCRPATIPGCDCFGCCTICSDGECHTIVTNPAVAPDCTLDRFDDPSVCPVCTPIAECATPCGGCVLCPGQDPSDLPPECDETPVCPAGSTACATSDDCADGDYCSSGCCVAGGLI